MSVDPIVSCSVSQDGKIGPGHWEAVRSLLRAMAGRDVEIIVRRHREKRSTQANRYYFGVVVKLLAEHCGYETEEMHEALAMKFLRIEDCPITGSPRRKRTPQTDSIDFAEYIDACIRLAAEMGVVIPTPGEVEAA